MRRHVKGCGNYGKWDDDCPPNTKLKCPLIICRYEMGPTGRKVRKEQLLGTNDEAVAWELIKQMIVGGETKPAEPPKAVQQSVDDFLTLEKDRKVGESTLKSFRSSFAEIRSAIRMATTPLHSLSSPPDRIHPSRI